MRWIITVVIVMALISPVLAQAPLVRCGMRGEAVREIQELLVELGHELVVDGIFGTETESLVMHVQKALGLAADGVVGPKTSAALDELKHAIVPYTVQQGDNLTLLARRYETTVGTIASFNSLSNPDRLFPGQVLLIPTAALPVFGPGLRRQLGFSWPVQGTISSAYGYRVHPVTKRRHFHGGIDIAVPVGTPVRAAQAGRVLRAGSAGSFGLAVVLDHGQEVTTWYGHNSKLAVRAGDSVQRGQIIAYSGRTGVATGPHLDFRIKIRDQTVDPLEYLP
ncbi:MAG TPA: peptidoglycan DD-metalloendopeptidase family protein [Firmicutes bacterium]|nr:peptidoglycan DD-metalloendopeptidase family protein [Bacillota bacterium]